MNKEITIGTRIGAMIFDHFVMTLICVGITAVFMGISAIIDTLFDDHWILFVIMGIAVTLTFSVYINKDALKGQSPAKRSMKLQVIDIKTGKTASPLKCMLRNLLLPIWIVELPSILTNPQRRLGDLIAGTIVEPYDSNKTEKIDNKAVLLAILIGMIYMAIIFGLYFGISGKLFSTMK